MSRRSRPWNFRTCTTCSRPLGGRREHPDPICTPCWRLSERGPRLAKLLASFELILKRDGPGSLNLAAGRLGVSPSNLSHWRAGRHEPSGERVLALRDFVYKARLNIRHAL
jgi:hypothetical protein